MHVTLVDFCKNFSTSLLTVDVSMQSARYTFRLSSERPDRARLLLQLASLDVGCFPLVTEANHRNKRVAPAQRQEPAAQAGIADNSARSKHVFFSNILLCSVFGPW